jgi:hypothetical protein
MLRSIRAKLVPAAFNQSMKLTDRTAPRILPEFAEPHSAHIRVSFSLLEEQHMQILRR